MVIGNLYTLLAGDKVTEEERMTEDSDNLEDFEAKETARKLPIGWVILFWGLIIWGVYYFVSYTPAISGWSQAIAYEEAVNK